MEMKPGILGAVCAASAALLLSGCGERTINAANRQPNAAPPNAPVMTRTTPVEKTLETPRGPGKVVSDVMLTAAIKTKLLADKTAPGMKINVDTKNGVV